MESFLVSSGVVALAEIGDKTQLLAFILAARFRQPVPIILGILVATVLNHALAAAAGVWLIGVIDPNVLRWLLGITFLGMMVWALIPDRLDDAEALPATGRSVFVVTLIAFFLAEMGDKTQLATIALSARYAEFWSVTAGTTLGMMIANVPAVLVGERLLRRIPMRWVHGTVAAIFGILGIATLMGIGWQFGL